MKLDLGDARTRGARRLGISIAVISVTFLWRGPLRATSLGEASDCTEPVMVDDAVYCGTERRWAAEALGIDVRRLRTGDHWRSGQPGRMTAEQLALLGVPIEVNEASLEELQSLPGVGPVTARRIVETRPFASVDDLERVRGIGPKTLERVRPRVYVAP